MNEMTQKPKVGLTPLSFACANCGNNEARVEEFCYNQHVFHVGWSILSFSHTIVFAGRMVI